MITGFFDTISLLLSAQSSFCENCPASALHPITAALSTIGYYTQAGWIEQILYFGFGNWAILAYVLAGLGFLISVAMGSPPKMYLWFAIGPALFYWLVENRTPVSGVAWRVGEQYRNMDSVWELAEVGLHNTPYVINHNFKVYGDKEPDGSNGASLGSTGEASVCYEKACVSDFFAWFDALISDTVQNLIYVTGLNQIREGTGDASSNISPGGDLNGISQFQDISSQYRWQFFSSIADASVTNTDLRQLFATFMASECGDALLASIDKKQMSAVKNMEPEEDGELPYVLKLTGSGELLLWRNLENAGKIPFPRSLKKLIKVNPSGSNFGTESGIRQFVEEQKISEEISCRSLLLVVLQGFRWEAANIVYQVVNMGPNGIDPTHFASHMIYGWGIKQWDNATGTQGAQLDNDEALRFLEAYTLAHIFKNELRLAPQNPSEKSALAGDRAIQNTADFQAVNGQKSKFGELYVWARMVPYFQGQLLYFLAIAYPFACMLIVVPGMHSLFIQWMQYFIWAKLWDFGFALVMIIERTIWAMTVNKLSNDEVNNTLQWLFFDTSTFPGIRTIISPWHGSWDGAIDTPNITVPLLNDGASDGYGEMVDILLGTSQLLKLDLSTSDYIFIMSALYFAVPVVTGTLVLGAKSGMASMISSTMSQIAQPAGSAAGQSASADIGSRMKQNQAVARQTGYAKSLRNSGLASEALRSTNNNTKDQAASSAAQTYAQLSGIRSQKAGLESQGKQSQATSHSYGISGLQQAGNYFSRDGGGYIDKDHDGHPVYSGGSGPSSGKGASGDGSEVSGALEQAKKLVGGISNVALPLASYGVQADRHEYGNQKLGEQARYANMQAYQQGQGFKSQTDAQLAGLNASRQEAHASFEAEQAAWETANDYAQANSDFTGAIGLGAGYLDAGQAPTNLQGMARAGMLGSSAKNESKAAEKGGWLRKSVDGLQSGVSRESRNISTTPIEMHDIGVGSASKAALKGIKTLGTDTRPDTSNQIIGG